MEKYRFSEKSTNLHTFQDLFGMKAYWHITEIYHSCVCVHMCANVCTCVCMHVCICGMYVLCCVELEMVHIAIHQSLDFQ